MVDIETNKIAGAVLGTFLFTLSLNILADGLFAPKKPAKPGYDIPVQEVAERGSAQAAVAPEPIEVRLASANVNKGANAAKKCLACHSFEKGGPNKVGPNLWGVVGVKRAHTDNFTYSSGMKGMGGTWTFEELDKFLFNPKAMVKGTSMAFIGLSGPQERADVIAYLNSLSDNPQPLPKASAPAPAAAPAPADATTPSATPPVAPQGSAPAKQ